MSKVFFSAGSGAVEWPFHDGPLLYVLYTYSLAWKEVKCSVFIMHIWLILWIKNLNGIRFLVEWNWFVNSSGVQHSLTACVSRYVELCDVYMPGHIEENGIAVTALREVMRHRMNTWTWEISAKCSLNDYLACFILNPCCVYSCLHGHIVTWLIMYVYTCFPYAINCFMHLYEN